MLKNTEKGLGEMMAGVYMPEKLSELLELLRVPLQKLSETNIDKSVYNLWKRTGIIDALILKTEERKWNRISIMELVILNIVNVLWQRKIKDEKIKEVVNKMLSEGLKSIEIKNPLNGIIGTAWYWDNSVSSDYLGDLNEKTYTLGKKVIQLGQDLDLMMHLNTQKKLNPHLPKISWIESFIIGSIRTNRPYSIILFDDGEIMFFFTDTMSDELNPSRNSELLKRSFTNISINRIVSDILSADVNTANGFNTLTSENNIMLKLLEKGYDANTINELFERNSDLIYTDESLPVETKIEKAINEFANQDLLIKIRDSKKKIIKRLIITKK